MIRSASEIIKGLGTFNKGLSTDSWRLLEYRKYARQGDSSLLVSITEKEFRELQQLGMRPRLGLGCVKFQVVGGGAGGAGPGHAAKEEHLQKRGPETSNMGVDDPVSSGANAAGGGDHGEDARP